VASAPPVAAALMAATPVASAPPVAASPVVATLVAAALRGAIPVASPL
jgi:hypothetical protein